MKYLLYYIDGFIRKFPLEDTAITIGRTGDNDLVIDDDTISRKHAQIKGDGPNIAIKDLDSTNGTYINGAKVHEATIGIGDSFCLGRMEFVLKEGTSGDFTPAKELLPIFNRICNDNETNFKKTKTRYIADIYNEILKQILRSGMKKKDFGEFIPDLSGYLSSLTYIGDLFLVSGQGKDLNILFSIQKKGGFSGNLEEIVNDNPGIYAEPIECGPTRQGGFFYSYNLEIDNTCAALVYISETCEKKQDSKIKKFLLSLSKVLTLLSQLFSETKPGRKQTENYLEEMEEIIVGNEDMRTLIKQTKKIARSDVFILIQGESGTGKELFAKLIYKNSNRHNKSFVAINCAAIPENLLESELFGHEKGAFTSAYTRKTGKLEIASGGTLVLDEIGDMPLNLQSKLLRALQEQEFYRLGSSQPIKVDLRIISLTNQNLKQAIKEKRFREDLYYRLVHHTINVPPLRERKEDISVLINFFTDRFCREIKKTVRGYSLNAFKALQEYDWPGNVRQLENEIKRIVNLTDDGNVINFDILSDDVKFPNQTGLADDDFSAPHYSHVPEEERILKMLEKNNWNKSRVARALNMTYQGLHKKLKRLGIEKPGDKTSAKI